MNNKIAYKKKRQYREGRTENTTEISASDSLYPVFVLLLNNKNTRV